MTCFASLAIRAPSSYPTYFIQLPPAAKDRPRPLCGRIQGWLSMITFGYGPHAPHWILACMHYRHISLQTQAALAQSFRPLVTARHCSCFCGRPPAGSCYVCFEMALPSIARMRLCAETGLSITTQWKALWLHYEAALSHVVLLTSVFPCAKTTEYHVAVSYPTHELFSLFLSYDSRNRA